MDHISNVFLPSRKRAGGLPADCCTRTLSCKPSANSYRWHDNSAQVDCLHLPQAEGFARALKPPTVGVWSLDNRQCRSSDIRKDQTHQNHLAEVVSGWTNVRRRHAVFPISSGLTPSSIPPLDEGQINHRDTDKDEENSRCDLQSLVERERCRTGQGLRSSEFRRRCDPIPPWQWRS